MVRRMVSVLHLLATARSHTVPPPSFDLTDAVTAQKASATWLGQFGSLGNQFLMDPDQVAAAGGIELQKAAAGAVGRAPNEGWKATSDELTGSLSGQPAGDTEAPCNLPGASSLVRAAVDGHALVLAQHGMDSPVLCAGESA